MPRCGDCCNFIPQLSNAAANTGVCKAFLDEDGLGKETDIYGDVGDCPKFEELERIRTDGSEFMVHHNLRIAKGFDEK